MYYALKIRNGNSRSKLYNTTKENREYTLDWIDRHTQNLQLLIKKIK